MQKKMFYSTSFVANSVFAYLNDCPKDHYANIHKPAQTVKGFRGLLKFGKILSFSTLVIKNY